MLVFVKHWGGGAYGTLVSRKEGQCGHSLHAGLPHTCYMANAKQASTKALAALQSHNNTSLATVCDLFCVLIPFLKSETELKGGTDYTGPSTLPSTMAAALRLRS